MSVIIETSQGDLVIDLYVKTCPKACTNFLKLCKIKYYNNCLFHTIQRDFIALTGDPNGDGNGGDSIWGYYHSIFYHLKNTQNKWEKGIIRESSKIF